VTTAFCSWIAALVTAAEPSPARPTTVPFELLRSGHVAVQVKVNGKGPYRVLFDTGAPINLFNNKVARQAGLLDKVELPALPLFGAAGEVKIKRLEVGGQVAGGVPAMVMDHPTIEAISRVLGPVDGLVGFPFFARFKTTIDYKARTLTFEPNGFQPPDVLRALVTAVMSGVGDADQARVLTPAAQWGLEAARDSSDESAGIVVKQVMAGGPAARAGLRAGNHLLTVDGRWTDTVADLFAAAEKIKPGTEIKVRYRRDGRERESRIKPVPGL
jgi:hypothetical protein